MQIEPNKQYKMRNGECATVLAKNPKHTDQWIGVDNYGQLLTWYEGGSYWRDGKESSYDLRAPWPAPVVRDLVIAKCNDGSVGVWAVQVNALSEGFDHIARFRTTWNPAQPDVLGWERVK